MWKFGIILAAAFFIGKCTASEGAERFERIASGDEANIDDYKFLVRLYNIPATAPEPICSGSIVSPVKVLTAATCCSNEPKYAVIGTSTDHNKFYEGSREGNIVVEGYSVYNITKSVTHPNFTNENGTTSHNLCVVTLDKDTTEDEHETIEINYDEYKEEECFFAGWGNGGGGGGGGDGGDGEGDGDGGKKTRKVKTSKSAPHKLLQMKLTGKITTIDDVEYIEGADTGAFEDDRGGPLVCDNKLVAVYSHEGNSSLFITAHGEEEFIKTNTGAPSWPRPVLYILLVLIPLVG